MDAVYIRTGPSRPDEESQRRSILAYLKESGLTIPDTRWFSDKPPGQGAAVERLLELVLERQVRRVFVSTRDRSGGREHREWLPLFHVLRAYGAELTSIQDGGLAADGLAADTGCPEFVEMLSAIANGPPIGPAQGWYHPAQSRYGWSWLTARHGIDPKGGITPEEFQGPAGLFGRLDRHGDGVLNAADFDWWDEGRQRRAEVFLRGRPPGMNRGRWLSIALRGDVGSPFDGPGLGQLAPDFTLTTQDGKDQMSLSHRRRGKPAVLVFGNYT